MDGTRLASLTRSGSHAGSRRRAVSAVLGGSLAALGLRDIRAKKKKKRPKPGPTCPPPTTCPPPATCPTCEACAGDFCIDRISAACSSTSDCSCWRRLGSSAKVCARLGSPAQALCGCTSDTSCQAGPLGPTAVCGDAQAGRGMMCGCDPGQGICVLPCAP
jgi:hypothetical protein